MENTNRTTLAEVLRLRGGNPFTPDEVLIYLKAITGALTQLHGRGLVHGDVKASNVFHDAQGMVYLDGYGFAQQIGSRSVVRKPVDYIPHLAPELVSSGVVNEATDVYSLGVLAYELLTGEIPVGGSASSRKPHQVNATIPPALSQVVWQAMAVDPSTRFTTPIEFLKAACGAMNRVPDQVADRLPAATVRPAATVVIPAMPAAQATVAIPATQRYQETQMISETQGYAAEFPTQENIPSRRFPAWLWIGIGAVILILLVCVGLLLGSQLSSLVGGSKTTPSPTLTATLLASTTSLPSPTQISIPTSIPATEIVTQAPPTLPPPPPTPPPTPTIPPQPTSPPPITGGDLKVTNRFPYPIYVFRGAKLLNSAPIPTGNYLIFYNQPAGVQYYSFCKDMFMNKCNEQQVTISGDTEITVP